MKIGDMHCDTLYRLYSSRGKRLQDRAGHLHLDGLLEGGYILQNFAAYMERCGEGFYSLCCGMIDLFDRELEDNSQVLAQACSRADIENNMHAGKISAVLTVEGGEAIEGDMEKLYALYNRGVRMMNLCWKYKNELGTTNVTSAEGDCSAIGLTDFGFQVVEEMERLGMIVDVSHLSDAGFRDVAAHSKKPFAASHSNARALTNHPRNMPDAMIRTLADKGGIMGINFYANFLGVKSPEFDAAIAHIRHIRNLAGDDLLALGSDFDGIDDPGEFQGAWHMQAFVRALEKAGFAESFIEKIAYRNLLDFYGRTLV